MLERSLLLEENTFCEAGKPLFHQTVFHFVTHKIPPRQCLDKPQLMNVVITGTVVTFCCSLGGGKAVRREEEAPRLVPRSEPPPCDKFHTLLREID